VIDWEWFDGWIDRSAAQFNRQFRHPAINHQIASGENREPTNQ
jgi:hypothetical protein